MPLTNLLSVCPLLAVLLPSLAVGQGAIERKRIPAPTDPYGKLTDNYRDQANFNVETVRGLAIASDGDFYALNTHGSLLIWHANATPEPEGSWPTLINPVSLGIWGDLALVAGGATHALAIHDRFTGAVLAVRMLPNEPGDLVIDESAGIVYIASQAENIVIALDINDLDNIQEVRRYVIPGEQPRFLNLDVHPMTGTRSLIVAPMLSGNNTIPVGGREGPQLLIEEATGEIYNLRGLVGGGLPDEDLFVLPLVGDPVPAELSSGREAGTLMMAHGRNPVTGEYWALSVDLHNDIPGQRSEGELKGVFATNALAIFAPDGLDAPKQLPDRIIDLDDNQPFLPGPQYAAETSVSYPYALEFIPAGNAVLAGWAVVASSTGDRIEFIAPNGIRAGGVRLPEGSIPRDLVVSSEGNWLGVYCWGTNELLVFMILDLSIPPVRLELGLDPAPESVKNGRAVFYDAKPSLNGRVTCASCHAAAGGDNLSWKLSGLSEDQKDVMVTQSLIGIQDTPLYHWREERTLRDFNVAFPGLLGHENLLEEADLDDLVDFIVSLQPHANHEQSRKRVVDDARTPKIYRNGFFGSAVRGQDHFLNTPSGSVHACGDCHTLPSGTLGVTIPDTDPDICRAQTVGVPHLRQLTHRDQDVIQLSDPIFGGNTVSLPRGGTAFLHSGIVLDLLGFAQLFNAFSAQEQSDIASFLHQFDQGIAPAAHFAIQMDVRNADAAGERIRSLLLRQAKRGWIDVVAFGTTNIDYPIDYRWLFHPGTGSEEGTFEPDGTNAPSITLDQFIFLARNGLTSNVFMGLPPGGGEMWALDPDGDGLRRQQELALGTDPQDIDTDDDTFPDGYEVEHGSDPLVPNATVNDTTAPTVLAGYPKLDHVTATFAKFYIECDEPVRLIVDSSVPGGPIHQTVVRTYARRHTVVAQGLDSSHRDATPNSYTSVIRAIDRSGNETTSAVDFTVLESCAGSGGAFEQVHINDLEWATTSSSGPDFTATAEFLVEFERGAPFPPPAVGSVVVAQLFVRTDPADPWELAKGIGSPLLRRKFKLRQVDEDDVLTIEPYNALPGPFLLSLPTGADGRTQISFHFPGIVFPGGNVELRLSVQAVLRTAAEHTLAEPVFEYSSLEEWSMPATAAEHRGIEFKL